ncbi:hypothetical protein [Lactobacillus sp. 382-1]|uniref:hypothetical protein n=1 Tax=Lactiplantibacillus pingfangensis TaxID=2559915 RepID=UPI0010F8A307
MSELKKLAITGAPDIAYEYRLMVLIERSIAKLNGIRGGNTALVVPENLQLVDSRGLFLSQSSYTYV